LLEIHRNERCEAASSKEWEQMHRKSLSQTFWFCTEQLETLTDHKMSQSELCKGPEPHLSAIFI